MPRGQRKPKTLSIYLTSPKEGGGYTLQAKEIPAGEPIPEGWVRDNPRTPEGYGIQIAFDIPRLSRGETIDLVKTF